MFEEVRFTASSGIGNVNSQRQRNLDRRVHIENVGMRRCAMAEEINCVVTDYITDVFLVAEESGRTDLLREGITPERNNRISIRYRALAAGVATRNC